MVFVLQFMECFWARIRSVNFSLQVLHAYRFGTVGMAGLLFVGCWWDFMCSCKLSFEVNSDLQTEQTCLVLFLWSALTCFCSSSWDSNLVPQKQIVGVFGGFLQMCFVSSSRLSNFCVHLTHMSFDGVFLIWLWIDGAIFGGIFFGGDSCTTMIWAIWGLTCDGVEVFFGTVECCWIICFVWVLVSFLVGLGGGIVPSNFLSLIFVYFFSISSTTLIDRFLSREFSVGGGGEASRVGGTLRTVSVDVLDGEPYCLTVAVDRCSLFSNFISSKSILLTEFRCDDMLGSATTRALFFILKIFCASLMLSMLNTRFLMVW